MTPKSVVARRCASAPNKVVSEWVWSNLHQCGSTQHEIDLVETAIRLWTDPRVIVAWAPTGGRTHRRRGRAVVKATLGLDGTG